MRFGKMEVIYFRAELLKEAIVLRRFAKTDFPRG